MLPLQNLLCVNLHGPELFTCATARKGAIKPGQETPLCIRQPLVIVEGVRSLIKISKPECGEWNKIGCIHTIEYYLAIKRNKVLIYVTTWINLENIIVSERNNS